jgi:hypothetical protein
MNNIENIHTCKKSKGKTVMISTDHTGQTYCGYCGQRVDYKTIGEPPSKESDQA